jgi:hypothetical protein
LPHAQSLTRTLRYSAPITRTRAAAFSSVSDTFPYSLIYTDPPLPVHSPSPLHVSGWATLLSQHPDRLFVDTLLHIIQYGARIGYCGPRQSIISPNLTSATAAPSTLSNDIARELSHRRIMQVPAPDTTAPDAPFICSPLGLVPKGSGGWRRIHHLSYPRGSSVNDHIPAEWAALEYATVDQAIALVATQGPGAMLVKRDLQDAFRHILIAPQDLWLLGFCWEGTYWVDCFLPFGLRTAPYIFDLFAKALHWILDSQASPEFETIHYLDDFLGVGPAGVGPAGVGPASPASEFSRQFEYICNRLGLRIKESKSITGTIADFGGIELYTLAMEARLPSAKLHKATELVEHALKKGKLSLQELQSLIGFLSFCCKVVPLGRSFLRRLYDATSNYPRTGTGTTKQRRRLTSDMKADLRWWQRFLPSWNGIAIIRPARATLLLWTDASRNDGLGGYFLPSRSPGAAAAPSSATANNPAATNNPAAEPPTCLCTSTVDLSELTWSSAFSKPHPRHHRHKHINYKEMLAILTAFRLWLPEFSGGKHIAIHTDNTAVYHGLNKRSMRGPAMEPLREITLLAALHDITFSAHWIPTSDNLLADLLSRRQFAKIADLCPLLS